MDLRALALSDSEACNNHDSRRAERSPQRGTPSWRPPPGVVIAKLVEIFAMQIAAPVRPEEVGLHVARAVVGALDAACRRRGPLGLGGQILGRGDAVRDGPLEELAVGQIPDALAHTASHSNFGSVGWVSTLGRTARSQVPPPRLPMSFQPAAVRLVPGSEARM